MIKCFQSEQFISFFRMKMGLIICIKITTFKVEFLCDLEWDLHVGQYDKLLRCNLNDENGPS